MKVDALLLVSFGGPEGPADVLPFLAKVTRGRPVPPERLAEIAERYQRVGGVSPLNGQCRRLLADLGQRCASEGITLPWYWGNRNWHPFLTETVATMADAGVRRALAIVTSAYGSYSACRQYREEIAAAAAAVGPRAPEIIKLRHFNDHPGYVMPYVDSVLECLRRFDSGETRLIFTAHSIPVAMNAASGPDGNRYLSQVRETASLVAAAVPVSRWDLAWQSASGPAGVPWLEPDVNIHLARVAAEGVRNIVLCPIGFVFDNFEVLWDLDRQAAATARRLGLRYARSSTPGTDPRFVDLIVDLVRERLSPSAARHQLDDCPDNCCAESHRHRPLPA
jgi:ferrochelatase